MTTMYKNKIVKAVLIVAVAITACLLITGCADSRTPYDVNNDEGFTVSVKYDANGGTFGDNASLSVIVDSFNPDENESIVLLSPDDPDRGAANHFTAQKSDCFLVGWYKECIKESDGSITYSDKWDFEKDKLSVDPDAVYNADEPVLTLYAAWLPRFEVEFYNLEDGELIDTYKFDPNFGVEIKVPSVDTEKGELKMHKFPEKDGFTFKNVYYDEAGTEMIDADSVVHPGNINYDNATLSDNVLKLYVEWKEGEWYYIYDAKQLRKHADENASYEILADLDFDGKDWPEELMGDEFKGTIIGNGHTVSNVSFEDTDGLADYESKTNLDFVTE